MAKKRSTPKAPAPTIRDMMGPVGMCGAWLSRTIPMAMARHPSRVGMYPDLRDGELVSRDIDESFTRGRLTAGGGDGFGLEMLFERLGLRQESDCLLDLRIPLGANL